MSIKNIANGKLVISNTENSIDNTLWNRLKYFYSKYSIYIIPILIFGTTSGLTYVVYTFLLNIPEPGFFSPNPPPRPSRPSIPPMIPPRPYTPPYQPPLPPQYPSPSSPFINPTPPINPIFENDSL